MKLEHRITMDLLRKGITPRIDAVQDDSGTRTLVLELTAGGRPWLIPRDAQAIVHYAKPDRTGGSYDTLPDGTPACTCRADRLSVVLAPQVLTAVGRVELAVTLLQNGIGLTTFAVQIEVHAIPGFAAVSEGYSYVSAFLPQPTGSAQVGQYLRVGRVGAAGQVLSLEAVDAPTGGAPDASVAETLLSVLRRAVYTEPVGELLTLLESGMSAQQEKTVTGISAVYPDEAVPIGTPLSFFLGKLSVTVYYSDGSSALLDSAQYSLSGTDIASGNNEITVTYLEHVTSFCVTGSSVLHTISVTRCIDGVQSTATQRVADGSSYSSTMTLPENYVCEGLTVSMGGADITDECVSGRTIRIAAVTADVQIVLTAQRSTAVFYSVTRALTNATCTGVSSVAQGDSFAATVVANTGYTLQSVCVTMGGTDITASVCTGGTIYIYAVTGDVVITAVAATEAAQVTLTGISASYSGGEVPIGTDASALEGITVTAHYSDGSTQAVTKYAISGTIAQGQNLLTISYGGYSAYISVTGIEAVPAYCTITNELTNASTNNTLPGLAGGSAYTATITASDGYTLKSVYVTMGGTDVTAQAWNAQTGVISIAAVTGNVVITARAVGYTLRYSWDFTESLTDTVANVTAVLGGDNATAMYRDSEGVHITGENQAIQLTQENMTLCNRRIEIDLADGSFATPTGQHGRLFGIGPDTAIQGSGACFTWRYNTDPGWTVYQRPGMSWGASLDSEAYPITYFHGKTVRLDFDESCYLTLSCATLGTTDFTTIATFEKSMTTASFSGVYVIGSFAGQQLFPGVCSGVRIYEKEA